MIWSGKKKLLIFTEFLCLRQKIALQHKLIPKYMSNWKIENAVAAARTKVELMKIMQDQMITTLPLHCWSCTKCVDPFNNNGHDLGFEV